jgi:hypothetical protein
VKGETWCRHGKFRSKRLAERKAEDVLENGTGDRLVPYRCSFCGFYALHKEDAPARRRARPRRRQFYDDEE